MSPRLRHRAARLLAAAAFAILPAARLAAQVTIVDEGSFTITRNGERVGREEFTIRRTPGVGGAPVLVASATISWGERRLAPALRADSMGVPIAYAMEVRMGPAVQEQLKGAAGRGRFSAVSRSPGGESAREYILAEGAVILDDEVFHQYWFVAREGRAPRVAVLVPRRNQQMTVRMAPAADESLVIGGRPIVARHLVLHEPGGARRDLWVDADGRVLMVALPGSGLVALRDDPPR